MSGKKYNFLLSIIYLNAWTISIRTTSYNIEIAEFIASSLGGSKAWNKI